MDADHPLSVGAARSHALKEADVVFLMGARINWIMHYGLPPRFNKDVRIIQLDISPEAMSQNVAAEVGLLGDGNAIMGQMNQALEGRQWFFRGETLVKITGNEEDPVLGGRVCPKRSSRSSSTPVGIAAPGP